MRGRQARPTGGPSDAPNPAGRECTPIAAHIEGMAVLVDAALVRTTLGFMAMSGAPTRLVPHYDGLRLPLAATMDQNLWEGICELASDRDFGEYGAFRAEDQVAIRREFSHWSERLHNNRPIPAQRR